MVVTINENFWVRRQGRAGLRFFHREAGTADAPQEIDVLEDPQGAGWVIREEHFSKTGGMTGNRSGVRGKLAGGAEVTVPKMARELVVREALERLGMTRAVDETAAAVVAWAERQEANA